MKTFLPFKFIIIKTVLNSTVFIFCDMAYQHIKKDNSTSALLGKILPQNAKTSTQENKRSIIKPIKGFLLPLS